MDARLAVVYSTVRWASRTNHTDLFTIYFNHAHEFRVSMNVHRPSFMLLPDFGFSPGEDIHLGTLLLLSSETRLPDPDLPLNSDDRVVPPSAHIKRHIEHSWKFDQSTQSAWSAGLEADIPVFLPAGGGVGCSLNKSRTLTVECELVETERFVPTSSYVAKSLSSDFIQDYCKKKWHPSVYLVTGLKTARRATIRSSTTQGHDGHIKAKLDATSMGVAINAGPSLEASKGRDADTATYVEGPFLLAYQLKRLRLSSKGTVKSSERFNKFALFDDQALTEGSEQLDSWDVEDVQPETVHDV